MMRYFALCISIIGTIVIPSMRVTTCAAQETLLTVGDFDQLRSSVDVHGFLTESATHRLVIGLLAPESNSSLRREAVKVLFDLSEPGHFDEVLAAIDKLVARYETLSQGTNDWIAVSHIIRVFLESAPKRVMTLQQTAQAFDLYVAVLKGGLAQWPNMRARCYSAIANCNADLHARQDCAIRAVRLAPTKSDLFAFQSLLDKRMVELLRSVAFSPPVYPVDGYNVAAVALLAEYGDLPTAIKLRQLGAQRGLNKDSVEAPGGYVWQIEGQHDPQIFVRFLRSHEWVDYESRVWALRKCIKLGVPQSELCAALEETRNAAAHDSRIKAELKYLKPVAQEAGILRPEDWPEVKAPPATP